MFHAASAARAVILPVVVSRAPARKPTRGSGRGGVMDMFVAGDGPTLTGDDEQAPAHSRPAAIEMTSAELGRPKGGSNESRFTLEFPIEVTGNCKAERASAPGRAGNG